MCYVSNYKRTAVVTAGEEAAVLPAPQSNLSCNRCQLCMQLQLFPWIQLIKSAVLGRLMFLCYVLAALSCLLCSSSFL
jgi:hypothetical protein